MPRARNPESEDVVVSKKPRAPRTRAVVDGVDTVASVPRKRAPRKVVTKAIADTTVAPHTEQSVPHRKAPTPFAAERQRSTKSNRMFVVVLTLVVLITGSGVAVGMFDQGAIDVVAVVNERNEKISRGEVRDASGKTITDTVPVLTDTRPNGGLQIADPSLVVPAPTTETPATEGSSTATSTETSTVSSSETTIPADSTATTTSAQ